MVAGATATPMAIPDFSQITERYGPSVVNISVIGTTKVSNDSPLAQDGGDDSQDDPLNGPLGELLRRFQQGQGHPGAGRGGQSAPGEMPTRGQGSGFIVSADGIILTNAHVVKGAKEVSVKLTDRREFRAKVLGADAKTDIAVLNIEDRFLRRRRTWNETSDLKVGEWVLAIGSPFGLKTP